MQKKSMGGTAPDPLLPGSCGLINRSTDLAGQDYVALGGVDLSTGEPHITPPDPEKRGITGK